MIETQGNFDVACFEVSEHGRILSGNKRFCRMFGFSESEIVWHYITDFYRHVEDWYVLRDCCDLSQHHFVARMKNRKGRSFKCDVAREIRQDENGKIYFRNVVRRIAEDEVVKKEDVLPTESRVVVFVAKCAHCGAQVRVNTLAETHMRVLCDACAAKAYPDAFKLKAVQV